MAMALKILKAVVKKETDRKMFKIVCTPDGPVHTFAHKNHRSRVTQDFYCTCLTSKIPAMKQKLLEENICIQLSCFDKVTQLEIFIAFRCQ